jgi:cellulose synthase/poly-beta-1,6-N-acetylglucosamine synthase-like glycosyltransferase
MCVYGAHRYGLVWLYLKHRDGGEQQPKAWGELPRVTVQLPMFNEGVVAERIIDAAVAIEYPKDRLQIQVLDDSTDESVDISRRAVERYRAEGYDISLAHRIDRVGYKAGALEAGLESATGEFVAIFDADFIPPPDVLSNVVNHFTDDSVGMVQVRWEHLNRDASLLTKSQAIFLDGHFVIEHTARNRSGRFMHFNGTAGVWRRSTIDDAGGWQHDTLTEDLDLSYRAQLKGWRFVYLPQFAAPAELPPEMIAFKQQAHRWTKGSMQTALKLLPGILRSKTLSRHVKTEAFFHLTNTIVYPLMVILTVLIYPAFIAAHGPFKHYPLAGFLFGLTMFLLATCGASTFFVVAQRELFGRGVTWRTILQLPMVMALGVGISLSNARAVLEAWFQDGGSTKNEFVRTPKFGVTGKQRHAAVNTGGTGELTWWFKKLPLPILELAFGVYMTVFIFVTTWYGFAWGSLPFTTLFAAGYFYVGCASLHALWQMRPGRAAAEDDTPIELSPPAVG